MTESAAPNPGTPNRRRPVPTDDVRDELPHDLDPSGFVGPYQFPDNSRRRWPGVIYLVIAALCVGIYFGFPDSPIVNVGWLVAAGLLTVAGGHLDHLRVADARRRDRGARGGAGSRRLRRSATRRRNRSGVGCAAGRRGACCATPPRTRRRNAGWCSSTRIDGEVMQHLVEPNPDVDVLL